MNALLETSQLAFGYPGRTLGRDLNLTIGAGEIICLLGPNGGGKTTLLRTLLGLLPAMHGDILLRGKSTRACTPGERARAMAYVPQASGGSFDFTVRETVLMGRTAHLSLFDGPGAQDATATDAALVALKISHLAGKSVTQISAGERQLTLIARALAQASPLLIMDEPTANLDYGNQYLILDTIAEIGKRGAAVLFSTHDPDHALRVATHTLALMPGGILANGATRELLTAENLSQLYGLKISLIDTPHGKMASVAR